MLLSPANESNVEAILSGEIIFTTSRFSDFPKVFVGTRNGITSIP